MYRYYVYTGRADEHGIRHPTTPTYPIFSPRIVQSPEARSHSLMKSLNRARNYSKLTEISIAESV